MANYFDQSGYFKRYRWDEASMTSTLDPSHKQIGNVAQSYRFRKVDSNEYRNWVLENSMRFYSIRYPYRYRRRWGEAYNSAWWCYPVTSGRSLKEKTIVLYGKWKNLLWLAWFCVAFVRNNTVMQKNRSSYWGQTRRIKMMPWKGLICRFSGEPTVLRKLFYGYVRKIMFSERSVHLITSYKGQESSGPRLADIDIDPK